MPNKIIDLGEIDPANIANEQTNRILAEYFASNKKTARFKKNIIHTYRISNDIIYRFTFLKTIINRKSTSNPKVQRYEIKKPNYLDYGTFSKVFSVEGTLVPTSHSLLLKTKPERVIKMQRHIFAFNTLNDLQREIAFNKKFNYMGVKNPVILDEKKKSYTIMHKLKGKSLFDIINDDIKTEFKLTIEQRIEIAIQLLKAIKIIHSKKIIHRDIKPENIFIDTDTFEAKIFDFGLSKNVGEKRPENVGSFPFIPIEQLHGLETNEKSDLFSIAIIIARVFKLYPDYYYARDNNESEIMREKDIEFFLDRFVTLELNDEHKDKILEVILMMTLAKRDARYSADDALSRFEYIKTQIKLEKFNLNKIQILQLFEAGFNAGIAYEKLINSDKEFNWNEFFNLLKSNLKKIADVDFIIQEFVEKLGIKFLFGSNNKQEIFIKLNSLYKNNYLLREKLISVESFLTDLAKLDTSFAKLLAPLCSELNIILNKKLKYSSNIDDIALLNQKWVGALEKIDTKIKNLSFSIENGKHLLKMGKIIDLLMLFPKLAIDSKNEYLITKIQPVILKHLQEIIANKSNDVNVKILNFKIDAIYKILTMITDSPNHDPGSISHLFETRIENLTAHTYHHGFFYAENYQLHLIQLIQNSLREKSLKREETYSSPCKPQVR